MNILVLSKYDDKGASSRYRFYQYIPSLRNEGWKIRTEPLLSNNYIAFLYDKKKLPISEIILSYCKRIVLLLNKKKYDIIWIEQEAFPWIPFFIEKIFTKSKTKIVADYDDAFFLRYDHHVNKIVRYFLGSKIDGVMENADLILAGNDYLAGRARVNSARQIEIFPTVVDTGKYIKIKVRKDDVFTIGWIGSPGTAKYLYLIRDAFKKVFDGGGVNFSFVGAGELMFDEFQYSNIKWDETTEVKEISKFDVGIMPLPDDSWEKGKCGLKLIQYLSCGIPVIGSPVGVNDKIIEHGINGFKANSTEEWVKYFMILKNDSALREKMGNEGRNFIIKNYSLTVNSKRLVSLFKYIIPE